MKNMTPLQERFVLHWGEMGARWGINRTVAQIHALLFLSEKPLTAEDLSETLSVARSNVSTSLKELQSWGIVKIIHTMGDRRDHFTSSKDVWEIFRQVLAERKRREVDPTLAVLRELTETAAPDETYARERLADMREFFESGMTCFEELLRLPPAAIKKTAKLSGQLVSLLGLGKS